MDILGLLPTSSSENKYLLVITDCFTKWIEAFPLSNVRSKTIAKIIVKQVISKIWCFIGITYGSRKKFRIEDVPGINSVTRN